VDLDTSSFAGKTFLVVGGAGFIGSHIAERLLALKARVVVLDDLSNGKDKNLPSGHPSLTLVHGDVRTFDFDSLGELDGIFNEAARALLPSFQDPVTDLLVNAGGTVRILEHARKHDLKIVHASSGSVYGNPLRIPISEDHPLNPISPYGVSKLSSEYYCSMYHREFGLDVTALRYFNVYGPRQTLSEEMGVIPIFVKKALLRQPLRIFGDGKQTRDFLNVGDVVQANLRSYVSDRSAGAILNVGGEGKEVSIEELAHVVMRLCGSDAPLVYADAKPGDIRRLVADNGLAKEVIGYVPHVSLEQGLKQYIEYARSAWSIPQ
jgi:UDP-glucose 4-epimerase